MNIDEPVEFRSWAKVIKSPRSLEAFKRVGVLPEELDPVNKRTLAEALKKKYPQAGVSKELLQLRLSYANDARYKKLKIV